MGDKKYLINRNEILTEKNDTSLDIKTTPKCIICGKPLIGDDLSSEHVIHNALGGILEDSGIYCKDCNGKFGTNEDKAFTSIFAPFMDRLNVRRTRKTKGCSYTGLMYDHVGNQYRVIWKDKKTVEIKKEDGTFVGRSMPKGVKIKKSLYCFNLDNGVFKAGLSKIALNYAVHCGIASSDMEKIILDTEDGKKRLVNNPVIFPFVPMTCFDAIMEAYKPDKLFHTLRLFNTGKYLFVYIELFSTFQYYVLISERCKKDIDKRYSNYIEKNEKENEADLLKKLTPSDYKGADIIMTHYGISKDDDFREVDKRLSKEPEKDRVVLQLDTIGILALQEYRKRRSYECNYGQIVNTLYDSIHFDAIFKLIMDMEGYGAGDYNESSREVFVNASEFMNSFQFYTVFERDCVNIHKYKRYMPNGISYPESIYRMLLKGYDISAYTYRKFNMLEQRM